MSARAVQAVRDKGIASVAVVLKNSYIFPDHEKQVGELASELGFTQVPPARLGRLPRAPPPPLPCAPRPSRAAVAVQTACLAGSLPELEVLGKPHHVQLACALRAG